MEDLKISPRLNVITVTKVGVYILIVNFVNLIFLDGFGNLRILNPVTLIHQDPSKLGYLKESNNFVMQEHHRVSRKGKWYLDSAYSSHITGEKTFSRKLQRLMEEASNLKMIQEEK